MPDALLQQTVWLIPILPWIAAAWIALGYIQGGNRGEAGERLTARVALAGSGLSLLLLLGLDLQALIAGAPGQVALFPWLVSGDYRVLVSFTLDGLSLGVGTLFALISLLTLVFSINYLHREAGFQRFFMILSLFNGAMLLIVLAGNAVLAFAGWELAGVSSYLLIGYAFDRSTASDNANRAFITNRIGDVGFLLGIFLSFLWLGGVEWPQVLADGSGLSSLQAGMAASGFVLAALVKSAQLPFSPWITRSLEGPTPSSAVFYGSVMVHAGVYLVIRLEPLLVQSPALMGLLAMVGALTALFGLLVGLVQTDVKSTLMFSTLGQVGLMFLLCGLGGFDLAAWYLVLHAIWRAYQFLSAPALMHLMTRPARPVPAWLGRHRRLYTAALRRLWLDELADWLFTRPTRKLARDAQAFDEKVVERLAGLPAQASAISSLSEWERRERGAMTGEAYAFSRGHGLLGRLMEWLASLLHWFEEHLVLKGGGDGLLKALRHLGTYLMQIDQLLSQPRYLLLMIMATLVVIL